MPPSEPPPTPTSTADRRPLGPLVVRASLLLGAVSLLALVKPTFFGFGGSPAAFADLMSYRHFVAHWWERGQVPYRDFVVEYPPGGYPLFAVPYFLEPLATRATALVGRRVTQLEAYALGFAPLMMAAEVILIALVAREARATRGDVAVGSTLAWLVGYLLVMTPLAIVRFDLVATLATFGATMLLTRGRSTAAGALVGAGILVKLVPGLALLPVLGASRRVLPGRDKARTLLTATLVVLAGVLGWVAVGRAGILGSIRYHTERGFEVGSTYACLMLIDSYITGLTMDFRYDHTSLNVVGPGVAICRAIAPPLLVGSLALALIRGGRIVRRDAPAGPSPEFHRTLHRATAAALLAYMLAGKVLSPQYLIWLMPAVAVAGSRRERALFLVLCLLTTAIFPWNSSDVVLASTHGQVLMLARNAGLVVLFAWLLGRPPGPRSAAAIA